jgi:hypothetical protein
MVRLPSSRPRRRGAISRSFLIGLALFVLFAGLAIWRQIIYIRKMPPYRPYLSANIMPGARSTGMVKTLALGYDDAVAVLLWMRTIQDFGGQFRDPFALRALSNAFFSMAALSPLFTPIYDFGGLVIGDEGGSADLWLLRVGAHGPPGTAFQGVRTSAEAIADADEMRERAMRLFDFGIEHDVDHYIHPYNAAYTALNGFHTPRRGIPYAEIAVTRPDCPDWVQGVIPYLLGRSGEYRIALLQWFAQLRAAIKNQDALGISIRMRKIAEDGVDSWNDQILTDALHLWSEMHGGALPETLETLGSDGFLLIFPEDLEKVVNTYRHARGGENPPSIAALFAEDLVPRDVEPLRFFDYSRFMSDAQRLIENATPFATISEEEFGLERYLTVVNRLPECPLTLWAQYSHDGTLIKRMEEIGPFVYMIDRRERVVYDSSRVFEDTARDLVVLRTRLDGYHQQHGEWPASLDALYTATGETAPVERATGRPFAYDPATGIVRSTHFTTETLVFHPNEPLADVTVLGRARPK